MLWYYLYYAKYFCNGIFIISLLITACALYAYSVNSKRADDDPKKRSYRIGAMLLLPFTWPFLLLAFLSLLILRIFVYGIFLIAFIIILLVMPREHSEPYFIEDML